MRRAVGGGDGPALIPGARGGFLDEAACAQILTGEQELVGWRAPPVFCGPCQGTEEVSEAGAQAATGRQRDRCEVGAGPGDARGRVDEKGASQAGAGGTGSWDCPLLPEALLRAGRQDSYYLLTGEAGFPFFFTPSQKPWCLHCVVALGSKGRVLAGVERGAGT